MERAKEQLPPVVKESMFCEGYKAAQRAGEGEAKRLFDGHTEGDECDCPFPNWCLFEAGYKAAQRAGEPPTPDEVERAAVVIDRLLGDYELVEDSDVRAEMADEFARLILNADDRKDRDDRPG